MATALECPKCGNRNQLDSVDPATKIRCAQCGQSLRVPDVEPAGVAKPAPATVGGTGATSPARTAPAPDVHGAVTPPPRRGVGAAATATGVSVTVSATGEASTTSSATATDDVRPARGRRKKVHWYWRLLAWVVAVPLGFVLTVVPSYKWGLISKDDLLDVFVGSGTERYTRLALVTLIWAVVTAILVQLFVEGGKILARRRREKALAREVPRIRAVP